MTPIKKLFVSLHIENKIHEVGELVSDGSQVYFRYHPDFLNLSLNLSPFKLKFNTEIQSAENVPFEGLFGLFADSLPDGWGRLLLDRMLINKGYDLTSINMLDRLAFVGSQGMGALVYRPEILDFEHRFEQLDLDEFARASENVLQGNAEDFVEELHHLGGSSGGARPKILVGFNPSNHQLIAKQSSLPEGYEPWMVKFPSTFDQKDIANIEYAYYLMAKDAGINISDSLLLKGNSGAAYFATKRFDFNKNGRLHMHSAAGLMHDNFRLTNMDYGHLMDCAFKLEKDVHAAEKVLRLAMFNVLSCNKDDHSKNVSFLMDSSGKWQLAPAYDLTYSQSTHGFQSMAVAGESLQPGAKHFQELANYFHIKNMGIMKDQVAEILNLWPIYALKADVQIESSSLIHKSIQKKLKDLSSSN